MNALDLLYAAGALVLSPVWATKRRDDWPARLGRTPPIPSGPAPRPPRLLIHAVSVGEVNALRTIVPALAQQYQLVISSTTDTGLARARALFEPDATPPTLGAGGVGEVGGVGGVGVIGIVRYPLDFSAAVARFLEAVRPDGVLLVELEVWPNFVAACARRGIPVGVINGRLSARSFAGYRRIRPFIGRSFARLAMVSAQDEAVAERFIALGTPPRRVHVGGSVKWDTARAFDPAKVRADAAALAADLGLDPSRPVVVAGSTSAGEERLLHEAVGRAAQLLCAPRKPERFDRAAADLPGCVRRSQRPAGSGHAGAEPSPTGRYLLDSLGELRAAYALADVAVVGRSFGLGRGRAARAGRGGSDPIEPAALGKPVICGPYTANFEPIVAALRDGGALRTAEPGTLRAVLGALLVDAGRRAAMGEAAQEVIRRQAGATARILESVRALIPPVARDDCAGAAVPRAISPRGA